MHCAFLPPFAPLPLLLGVFPCTATFRHSRRSIVHRLLHALIVARDTRGHPPSAPLSASMPPPPPPPAPTCWFAWSRTARMPSSSVVNVSRLQPAAGLARGPKHIHDVKISFERQSVYSSCIHALNPTFVDFFHAPGCLYKPYGGFLALGPKTNLPTCSLAFKRSRLFCNQAHQTILLYHRTDAAYSRKLIEGFISPSYISGYGVENPVFGPVSFAKGSSILRKTFGSGDVTSSRSSESLSSHPNPSPTASRPDRYGLNVRRKVFRIEEGLDVYSQWAWAACVARKAIYGAAPIQHDSGAWLTVPEHNLSRVHDVGHSLLPRAGQRAGWHAGAGRTKLVHARACGQKPLYYIMW
ncbi:hypothetical protein C8R47DRAFT_1201964 [Mycena vitilis]|nr:hypothetical protein C8R47DRAFT_1201964 [Mycena vitilis]